MIIVKYRYTVPMPDQYKEYHEVLTDWTTTKLKGIYYGKIGLLVCPYFRVSGEDFLYCQLLLDIEGKQGTKVAFEYARHLKKKYNWLTIEYTGKTGFHMASSFLVKLKRDETPVLRNLMLEPLHIDSALVDKNSSIRDMPTIRIGAIFKDRFAFPVLDDWDYEKFLAIKKVARDFEPIFTSEELKSYIKEWLLPNKHITYNEYLRLLH